MKPGEGAEAGWRRVSGPETTSGADTGHGTDGEGSGQGRSLKPDRFGKREDLGTEEGVFGVQNQLSEARLSKLRYIDKQAWGGRACELRAAQRVTGRRGGG